MSKILSEENIQKLLKDKKISLESYRKLSSVPSKKDELTIEDKRLEAISKQTLAIEKLSVLLHQNLVAILQKVSTDENSLAGNFGTVLKEHMKRLEKILSGGKESVRPSVKWKFKIHRNDRGRIESVEAEPETEI